MPALHKFLKVVLQESGEHVLITAGEVHLQRCIRDLEEFYAKIQINASQPIVPFRETIMAPLEPISTGSAGRVQIETPGKRFSMRLRAVSLPEEVTNVLEKHVDIIRTTLQSRCHGSSEHTVEEIQANEKLSLQWQGKITKLYHQLNQAFVMGGWGENATDRILSFGPRRCGPNVLLNHTSLNLPSPWNKNPPDTVVERTTLEFLNSVINGFQLATLAGPICEEPLHGVAFIVEDITIVVDHLSAPLSFGEDNNDSGHFQQQCRSFTGQIMSAVKDGCRRAFTNQPQRIMAAMYNCSIQVSGEVVGK